MVVNERYPIILVLKDHGNDFNLKPWLEDLQYDETGNDEISNATIVLNSKFGRFLQEGQVIGNHTFPKIQFFDRIYMQLKDPNGVITEDVLQVLKFKPDESGEGAGNTLTLLTEHQGFHFFRMHNLKQYQRESGFEVIKDQGAVYTSTDVRGTKQPSMEKHDVPFSFTGPKPVGNAASEATYIDFDFKDAEFYIGDGVNIVSKRLGGSVESGGELEFFDWRTISKYNHTTGNDLDVIQMQFRVSGDIGPTATKVVLDKTTATINKILDSHGELEPEKSTSVYGWGDMNMGSQPPGYQVYFGEKEFFLSALLWTDGRFYKAGMRVRFEGGFFKCLVDNTANLGTNDPLSGIGFFWNVETFTPSTNYSNWTKNKPTYWLNSGFGYIFATTFPSIRRAACHDFNLVIRDINHRRSWCDKNAGSLDDIPSSMYLQGGGKEMYRTFRILVDQNSNPTIGVPFNQNSGKDRFGKSYVDSVVQHNGNKFTDINEYKNWDVFLEAKNDLEIISSRDGISFVYAPCDNLNFSGVCSGTRLAGWQQGAYEAVQISGVTVGGFVPGLLPDCIHPYHITGLNNPDFINTQGVEDGVPGQNSGVRIGFRPTDSALAHGAWINLAFPIPRDGFGGAFTATVAGEKFINPTFDLNNMHLSSTGKRGLNQGADSEFRGSLEYGKINATRLYLKLEASAFGFIIPGGDFKFRIALFDTGDNTIVGDATITHNFNYSEIEIEITNFQIWRGRHGLPFTPLQEIEILDVFETRNVVRIAISSLDSYDGDGRYLALNRYTKFLSGVHLNLDGFHFVKPLTAMTQLQTSQPNKPAINFEREPLDRGQISNSKQLENDMLSTLELERFKRVEYEVNRPLRCNIKFGDEFTFINPRVVNDTDFGNADSIDLVCKKNIHIYSKKRGYTTKTIGVKRFRT